MNDQDFFNQYKFEKPSPEAENVVLTCRSGRRVLTGFAKLEKLGYCNVKWVTTKDCMNEYYFIHDSFYRVYIGSYLDWKEKGGPLILSEESQRWI